MKINITIYDDMNYKYYKNIKSKFGLGFLVRMQPKLKSNSNPI